MTEQKLCGSCGKVEAIANCDVCGIPLCAACIQTVEIPDDALGYNVKGTTQSPVRQGLKKTLVCTKCLAETDFV